MELSITVEGMFGLNWENWPQLIRTAEEGGFATLFRSDHFVLEEPPYYDALELVVSLAYAAMHTSRVQIGSLVAPMSFRDPRQLARQTAAIDDLSGGRLILGLGAGWMDNEHKMFGYELGDERTRMARLEEGLHVIKGLFTDESFSFDGEFYQLQNAAMRPRPRRPDGPRILIGGNGPKRTLPLTARFGDVWNGIHLTPEEYRTRSARLDELLAQEGREPDAVKRTMTALIVCGRNDRELAQSAAWLEQVEQFQGATVQETLELVRENWTPLLIAGPPEAVVERLHAYADAGVEEIITHWGTGNLEGLQLLAEEVLPHL